MGSAIPRCVALCCISKQAEVAIGKQTFLLGILRDVMDKGL